MMVAGSFMEKIYEGVLDQTAFHSFRMPSESETLQTLMQAYRNLLKNYPVQKIEEEGRIPEEMLREMGKAGFFGISVSRTYGGLGVNLLEYIRFVEEIAAADMSCALVFLAHLFIGIKGIELFGTEEQKQRYLPPAASGEMIFSYALTEPETGSDARHIETTAELSEDGTHYVLNGVKTYITNANYARGLTVFAQMDPKQPGYMGAFIVETGWEGVKIGKDMPKMGLKASSTASIRFQNVRVPVENRIGKPGEGFKIAMAVLNYGRLALGAASTGLMEQSLKDMQHRARSRVQFGVPIQNFQLIQEKMINARVHGFVTAAMNYFTAGLLESGAEEDPVIETSHCKLFGSTRAWDVLYDALQLAGGSGYLSIQPYEKRMRDFRVVTIFEGTTEIHSVYPALYLLGRLGKRLRSHHGLSRWTFIARALFSSFAKMPWSVEDSDKISKEAVRLAKSNARRVKRMLLLGLLFYGEKVGEREYFLRRVTTLSLYLFGILAVLAKMTADRRAGILNDGERRLLGYFLEEAEEARQQSAMIFSTKKEKLGAAIFREL
jgi:acyl-CoA dehydrogenase family protein 9